MQRAAALASVPHDAVADLADNWRAVHEHVNVAVDLGLLGPHLYDARQVGPAAGDDRLLLGVAVVRPRLPHRAQRRRTRSLGVGDEESVGVFYLLVGQPAHRRRVEGVRLELRGGEVELLEQLAERLVGRGGRDQFPERRQGVPVGAGLAAVLLLAAHGDGEAGQRQVDPDVSRDGGSSTETHLDPGARLVAGRRRQDARTAAVERRLQLQPAAPGGHQKLAARSQHDADDHPQAVT